MKNFATMIKEENSKRKSFTENGAVAYKTSGNELLDFNFKLSQYRGMDEIQIAHDFARVYFENPKVAVKYLFYAGDVRGGLGERKIFRTCMKWLASEKPEVAKAVIELIPEYTRWDNLLILVDVDSVKPLVLDIVLEQLAADIANMNRNKPISLLAKWMPSINASSKETRRRANIIREGLEISPKNYRKTLSALRAYLDVVEVKASSNSWSEINYEAVPSQANIKYKEAFMKHDAERRAEYLESLKRGEKKINASVTQPHEVVRAYTIDSYWCNSFTDYDETLEQIWKNIPDIMVEDTLVVRDGSASMTSPIANSNRFSCLDIATALTIYCSEHNSEEWRDTFITFSNSPKFVDLSNCETLRDKLIRCSSEDDCSNTDIEATMMLILDAAIHNDCKPEDMPRNVLIISDMQFDNSYSWHGMNWNKTLFEEISEKYKLNGYKLPRIIFWNVCSRDFNTIPMKDNENGLILCSGFSTSNMKMFMTGEIDPYKVLLEQINDKRYDPVETHIKNCF